jgi:hypothetical protein
VGNVLTTTLSDVPAGTTAYIRVTAYSPGGESMPSETLTVRRGADGPSKFLVVSGFDRIGRFQDPRLTIPAGTMRRPIIRKVNSRDYTVQHAEALAAGGVTFDSCANEAVISGAVTLNAYRAVDWICGEESTADHTFDPNEQALVTAYLNAGGKLFATGAEIGWDLDHQNNGRSFYNNVLKADYSLDDANTYNVSVWPGSIFDGIAPFAFDDGTLLYDSEYPDVLNTFGGSAAALSYVGGTGGIAGVQYDGPFQVINFGFPLETITSPASRGEIMDRVIDFFFPSPFDADGDGDVDLDDFADFSSCLLGPATTHPLGDPCLIHDQDADLDVDLNDFKGFQQSFSG